MTIKVTYRDTLPRLPESAKDIRLKLDRSYKHIYDLKAAVDAFHGTKPYAITIKDDPNTGQELLYVERVDPIPDDISIIAGDAIQNARSALDYLAYRIYPGSKGDRIYFPIADSADKYTNPSFHAQVDRFGVSIAKRIDDIKPYKGGNDFIWRLHELNKIDKHRLIISAVSMAQHHTITSEDRDRFAVVNPKLIPLIGGPLRWTDSGLAKEPLKVGDIFHRRRKLTPQEKNNMEYTIQVTFNEPVIGEREPVVDSIYGFCRATEVVCRKFADLL